MLNITTIRFQSILSLALLVILAACVGLFMAEVSYDWQGMLLVLGGIGILAFFLLPRLARVEGGGLTTKVLIFGLLLKLGFSMVNYYFAFSVYGGTADASHYSRTGTIISQYIWQLEFDKVFTFLQWGTEFISFFTGVVYSVIGSSIHGGFLVYAFLSFLGSYYFYRAFRIALPDGAKRLYMLLIFFFPSILYWSSAIGKDALMFLCLGLFAYGCSQLIQNRLRGLMPLALGLMGTLWIRPHVAAMSILAFALAFFLPGVRKQPFRPTTYIIGLLAVGGLAWSLLPQIMEFLHLEGLSLNEVITIMQQRQQLTSYGGSALQVTDLNSPLIYLMSPITLLFRPFPWEAHNLQALVESSLGVLILCLTLWRIKSLGRAIASSISNIYLRYVLIYIIAFFVIFSALANLGLLARERVMLLPFFFMLVSYSPSRLDPCIE